ncbi:protein NPAT [Trichomycterus rosablanca]|uniref:protein NPAT n=1 Tax=Trichomycterus rosablanca TaxID=2290929 RepID=UPI002F356F7E
MLLPSDVARLVLGYLQQEGLSATSRAFIVESPNLREYAEHSTEDGTIPACVFSLFGKNLTTILNEYVAVKTKETCQENQIPAMMTSLWKKLDFTLNQIKSMQNSPAVLQIQRLRTQNSIQSMRRQRVLLSQSSSNGDITVSTPENCVASSIVAPQGILGHSTPVCYTSQQTRTSTISLSQPEDSQLHITVPDIRLTPGPLSPARRKCDSPRRRAGSQLGISRGITVSSTLTVDTQNQEAMTENLSQMVIENAREKILNDRFLQEKLAENINKILASDNSPQTSKAPCSTVEQEQSIDEILGLQGEIHMTDDAIQDILEQTESDPAFQALFDLFDYGKSKAAEGSEHADGSNSTQESDEPCHVDSATDTGTGLEDSTSGAESTRSKIRKSNVKEVKSKRKSAVPLSSGKPASAPSQSRSVAKQTATARGASQTKKSGSKTSNKTTREVKTTSRGQPNKKGEPESSVDLNISSSSLSEEGTSMEVDESACEIVEKTPQKDFQESSKNVQSSTVINNTSSEKASVSDKQADTTTPELVLDTSGEKSGPERDKKTQIAAEKSVETVETSGQSMSEPSRHRATHNVSKEPSQQPATNKVSLLDTVTQANELNPKEAEVCTSKSISSASAVSANAANSTSSTTDGVSQSQTTQSDPSKVVALKIIISDEQEQQGNDSALNQAVSSITANHVPTIFLSSPAKSPSKAPSVSSGYSITQEETAQAVNSLQGTESTGDLAINAANNAQPSQIRPIGQETGFIQLFPSNQTFGGASSFFVVSDTGAVSSTSRVVATPPRSRAMVSINANVSQPFTPASAIIFSSPVQPMLQNMAVPVSVFGQNSTGKITVVHNQMLAMPGPTFINQTAKALPIPKLMPKDSVELGKVGTSGSSQVPASSQGSVQIQSGTEASPSHRRILCFDESAGQTNASTSASLGVKESLGTERTQTSILGNTNAKRRVETIRIPEELDKAFGPLQQKETTKSTKPETKQTATTSNSSNNATLQGPPTKSQPNVESSAAPSTNTVDSLKSSSQSIKLKSTSILKDSSHEGTLEKSDGNVDSGIRQDSPGVTSNKENEVEGSLHESRQATASPFSVRSPQPVAGGCSKSICKTSPLTKQAAEMLQDIQSQSPISTPPRRKGPSDLSLPRTPGPGRLQEDFLDGLRTPLRQRREAEGTPKHLAPPATPDLPSCSPASEAGSENSINMAAHTLMILSRAARTGGPLKDSLWQKEADMAKSSSSKGKKRKHAEPSPTAKKELQLSSSSGSKKKTKKQKKLLDSFPHDLDVDKFLSSLHYDE